jgi:hypothetical protein
VRAGDVVAAGQLLFELTNPQLVASAEEAYSVGEGAVTELRAGEAELQTAGAEPGRGRHPGAL